MSVTSRGRVVFDFVEPVEAREVDEAEAAEIVFAKLTRQTLRNKVPPLDAVFFAFELDVPGPFSEKKAENLEDLDFVGAGVTFRKLVRAKTLHIKKN